MRKILLTLICLAIFIISSAYREGAPTGATCAQGETKCATNGLCHSGGINTSPGAADIAVMGGLPSCGYTPGQTYTLIPSLTSNDGRTVLGFETVTKLQNGNPAGSVGITNPIKTQKYVTVGYEYVTHTTTGSSNPGPQDWEYNWTAPSTGSGAVTIYGAFVAANGNDSSSGDLIYIDSLVIAECPTLVNEIDENSFSIYPNPSESQFTIVLSTQYKVLSTVIYNVHGEIVYSSKPEAVNIPQGETETINCKQFASGIYFVVVNQSCRKIVKQFCKI